MIPSSTSQDDQEWVARLQRWGLDEVAPVFSEVLRPFGPIGGQLLALASPLLTTFVAPQRLDRWIDLLDDPERWDQFVRSIDREADR